MRALIDRVLDVKARAPLDQQFHDLQVVGPNGRVERVGPVHEGSAAGRVRLR